MKEKKISKILNDCSNVVEIEYLTAIGIERFDINIFAYLLSISSKKENYINKYVEFLKLIEFYIDGSSESKEKIKKLFNPKLVEILLKRNEDKEFLLKKYNECINDKKEYVDKIKKIKLKTTKTYLMKDSSNTFTKIGISNNPKLREKTLQAEKPTISLLYTFNKNIEKELHSKYKDKRIRGEWFNLSSEDIDIIINKYNFKKEK